MSDSEAQFRTILENAPVMIDAFAADGSVLLWNHECERRLGWTAAELAEMDDPLAVFYPSEDQRAVVFASIERADGKFREYEVVAKDGTVRIQQWADFLLPNGSRISVGHDVTEQRKVEANLRQAQKMQALGTLSGGIAHDFNNLLTIICACASLAQREVPEDSEMARFLQQILKAGEDGADLVRRLMSFSRRDRLRRRAVVFDDVIAKFLPTLRRLIPESLELSIDLDAGDAVVLADRVAIEQVVINLVTNARDAIDGQGTISFRTRKANGPRGPEVHLEVEDDGSGMTRETQERVFEPFFTTKERGSGTGLGLPTAYGLVGQHEGTIDIRSAPGVGTTVRIRLPEHHADPDMLTPSAPMRGLGAGNGETILVVEDDRTVSTMTSRSLQAAGYVVLTASGGDQALAILDEAPEIALVLSDVVMPRMGGEELRRRMAEGPHASVPIAFMSGYNDELDESARLLPKPWTPQQLVVFVRLCLDEAAERNR
ncbi:MAG: response regulator [Deltaproteobacteria bacterium]|nr:response regulator [Deltaproteobacteria bacterium]